MARANLIFEFTADQADAITNFNGDGTHFAAKEIKAAHNITKVNSPVRSGTSSIKFDVRKTDPFGSDRPRGELVRPFDTQEVFERWYGMSFWLDATSYAVPDPNSETIVQWHSASQSKPMSQLGLYLRGNRFYINPCIDSGCQETDLGPITIGQWIDLVWHVKWTSQSSGLIEIWKNGVKWLTKNGPTTYAGISSYFKIGYNKWEWTTAQGQARSPENSRIMYVDEVRIGNQNATFDDVKPGDSAVVPNIPPIANAGADLVIKLPTNSITLQGTASDPDGTIASHKWEKVTGGAANIQSPNAITTLVTGLVAGAYEFKYTATDNKGAVTSDNVKITVQAADTVPPVKTIIKVVSTYTYSDNTSETVTKP